MTSTKKRNLYLAIIIIGLLAAHQSLAQQIGSDMELTVQQAGTWALQVARAAAVLIALAGFVMFATGRHAWQGGIVMLIGMAGALKADLIVQTLFGT